jgi:hypothetical protein
MFYDIGSFEITQILNSYDDLMEVKFELQFLILATLSCMYEYGMMSLEDFRKFFELDSTIRISAIAFFENGSWNVSDEAYYTSKYVLLYEEDSFNKKQIFEGESFSFSLVLGFTFMPNSLVKLIPITYLFSLHYYCF